MFLILIGIGLAIIIATVFLTRNQAASVSETQAAGPETASETAATGVPQRRIPESELDVSRVMVKGRVIVKQIIGRKIVERECRLEDDGTIRCSRNLIFTIPENYEPFIVFRGGMRKRAYLAFLYDEHGNAIELRKNGEMELKAPDPRITASIFNSKILTQVFRKLYMDPLTSLTFLIGGMGLMAVIIFFLLPAIGIPVTLGNRPIAVKVEIPYYNASIPPAGNFTPQLPGG